MKQDRVRVVLGLALTLALWTFAESPAPDTTNRPPSSLPPSVHGLGLQLPDVNFRDAPLREILEWVRNESRSVDPTGVGVNIIFKDDPDGRLGSTKLTIRMTRPTVARLLGMLSTTAGLYVRVDKTAIVIERAQTVPTQ